MSRSDESCVQPGALAARLRKWCAQVLPVSCLCPRPRGIVPSCSCARACPWVTQRTTRRRDSVVEASRGHAAVPPSQESVPGRVRNRRRGRSAVFVPPWICRSRDAVLVGGRPLRLLPLRGCRRALVRYALFRVQGRPGRGSGGPPNVAFAGAGTLLAMNPAGRASLGSRDVGGVRGVT